MVASKGGPVYSLREGRATWMASREVRSRYMNIGKARSGALLSGLYRERCGDGMGCDGMGWESGRIFLDMQ